MNLMSDLALLVENLKKSPVKRTIDKRIREFEKLGEKKDNEIFKELCYCILTANFNAERAIKIQNEIGNGFLSLPEEKLFWELSKLGHRFPYARTKYIIEARKYKDNIKEILNSFNEQETIREWLVKNIKGLGFKEASHFMRNIGYKNIAIIDFHIIDSLIKYGLIEKPKPKATTKYKYLEIENILQGLAEKTNFSLGELDLYLWYEETGKVLK